MLTDGRSWPSRGLLRWWLAQWDQRRRRLERDVEVQDGDCRLRYRCGTLDELARVMGLFVKEEGTCRWIREELQAGETFWDVGANIGLYSVLAAARAGSEGRVYAFEPHGANFARLIENIVASGYQEIVVPCNFALHDQEGRFPFNYSSTDAASSNSQLGTTRSVREETYVPRVAELKYAASADSLLASGDVRAPQHVKIDVDGNELRILQGMDALLRGDQRPRTVQVEINRREKELICPFMEARGYALADRHYTRSGLKRIAEGLDPEDYAYNAVFRPD